MCLCTIYSIAVQFALKWFLKRRPCLYANSANSEEWRRECTQNAWCAVLEYAANHPAPTASGSDICPGCSVNRSSVSQLWDSLSQLEREWVYQAAIEATKALERYWYAENAYNKRFVTFTEYANTQNIESRLDIDCIEDATALETLWSALTDFDNQRLLNSLKQRLNASDWEIVVRLLEGQSQKEIALLLGVTPSAVCQRLRTIAKKCAQVRREMGLEP